MPPRSQPVMETQLARDIYNELELYAKDKGYYPLQNALFAYMTRPILDKDDKPQFDPDTNEMLRHYKITIGEFNWWFERLVKEGYIAVDKDTRSIKCTELVIVERSLIT